MSRYSIQPWAIAVIICWFAASTAAQDIVGCGGFVTASGALSDTLQQQSLDKPDLSSVSVELWSPAGVKKAEGDCSPNGYYFVPVELGTYIVRVKGLPGWMFSPDQVKITCDRQHCHGGEDVNFRLVGLQLTGKVGTAKSSASCHASQEAPSGVQIQLQPEDRRSSLEPKVTKSQQGSYQFKSLLPGRYVITASHDEWQLQPQQISHTLDLAHTEIQQPFQVSGYRLTGKVLSKSGPVTGIHVTLYSSDVKAASCSGNSPVTAKSHAEYGTPICSAVSSTDGQYSFQGVPCGQYTLIASHPDPDSTFEIAPSAMKVKVGASSSQTHEPFKVTGFSIHGRVVDSSGNGISGVTIKVGGEQRAVTDDSGRYLLARMQEGKHHITAHKEHHTYTALSPVEVTPAAQALPDMTTSKLAACGKLTYADKRFSSPGRRVSIASISGDVSITKQTSTNATNHFCFSIAPGSYRVAPYVASDEKSRGLVFNPPHVDVSISGTPILDVAFSQGQLSLGGSIRCLESPCEADVLLTLTDKSSGKQVAVARLSEVAQEHASTGMD